MPKSWCSYSHAQKLRWKKKLGTLFLD
jgi:hypothetical protein